MTFPPTAIWSRLIMRVCLVLILSYFRTALVALSSARLFADSELVTCLKAALFSRINSARNNLFSFSRAWASVAAPGPPAGVDVATPPPPPNVAAPIRCAWYRGGGEGGVRDGQVEPVGGGRVAPEPWRGPAGGEEGALSTGGSKLRVGEGETRRGEVGWHAGVAGEAGEARGGRQPAMCRGRCARSTGRRRAGVRTRLARARRARGIALVMEGRCSPRAEGRGGGSTRGARGAR